MAGTEDPVVAIDRSLRRLPVLVQLRLVTLVNLVAGLSHEEKIDLQEELAILRRLASMHPVTAAALTELEQIVWNVDQVATPRPRVTAADIDKLNDLRVAEGEARDG